MFVERIEVPAGVATSPDKHAAVKVAAGILFLITASAVMLPWTAVLIAWTLLAALTRAGSALLDIARYAGEEIVGR